MVFKGQFLERSALVQVGEHVLEGLSHRGDRRPPLLIVPPMPREGGGMDHAVAAEVAWAAAMAGHPTLRFNFRGMGASQGSWREAAPDELAEDLRAALRLLEANTDCPECAVVTVGGSAALALELAKAGGSVCGVGLVNPKEISASDVLRISVPLLVVIAENDPSVPRAAWAAALAEQGGLLETILSADAAYARNLPQVGKAVVKLLGRMEKRA